MSDELVLHAHHGVSPVWVRLSAFLSLKSPETRRTYSGIMSEWCSYLGADVGSDRAAKLVLNATDLHAAAYRKWLESRPGEKPRAGYAKQSQASRAVAVADPALGSMLGQKKRGLESTQSNATIHKKFAALRRMYRVLIAHELRSGGNPFDTDRTPPPPKDAGRKRPTQMIDFELVLEVVHAPEPSTPKGLRDRAILATLFGGGLRRSELVALRVGDLRKTASGTVYLYLRYTKAKRDAEQALPDWAASFLESYVTERRADGAGDADYLFVGYTGRAGKVATNEPMSDSGVYRLFRSYCMQVGAGPFVSPHSARATAITKLLADGVTHREVQAFSRHSSIQMVELYDKRRFDVEKSPAKGLTYKRR